MEYVQTYVGYNVNLEDLTAAIQLIPKARCDVKVTGSFRNSRNNDVLQQTLHYLRARLLGVPGDHIGATYLPFVIEHTNPVEVRTALERLEQQLLNVHAQYFLRVEVQSLPDEIIEAIKDKGFKPRGELL
jgi:hypothetical protein